MVQLEEASCKPLSLTALLYSPLASIPKRPNYSPVVNQSLRIWRQFRSHFGFQSFLFSSPCDKNPAFPTSLNDSVFKLWFKKGIKTFKDLYVDKTFASFTQLSLKFSLPRSHLFRYFQIRDFIWKISPQFPNLPPPTQLDTILDMSINNKGAISVLYDCIAGFSPSSAITARQNWEVDLDYRFTDDEWRQVLNSIHSSSICSRHSLIQFKFIHRIYWTKVRLSKIKP